MSIEVVLADGVGVRIPGCSDAGSMLARGDCLDVVGAGQIVRPRRPDHRGRITVLRGPAPIQTQAASLDVAIDMPPMPGDPPAIAWIGALSSLVGGAVVALIFSPLFAILAGVSAVTLIGRSVAGRVSNRRARRRREQSLSVAEADIATSVAEWISGERERRLAARHSNLRADLVGGAMPWQRRLGDGGDQMALVPLVLTIGTGEIDVPGPAHTLGDAELDTFVPSLLRLGGVPLTVELAQSQGLALVGGRDEVLATARSAILDSLSSFGPSELTVALITTPDRLVDWDWLKWVPNLDGVAIDQSAADQLLDRPGCGPLRLCVIDGIEPSGPGAFARVVSGRSPATRPIWIGDRPDVPAACVAIAEIQADDSMTVERAQTLVGGASAEPGGHMVGEADQLGLVAADEIARCLAPFDDPLVLEAGERLPTSVSLADVLDEDDEIASCWKRADRSRVTAPIGRDLDGVVTIDLVADGPHALVAGTTGAGKSELARTLVVGAALHQPPDLVSFVLVDFKGGGAFDLVADLPHVASVVTDLDAASASRALRSLRAELRSREERLRDLGVADIGDVVLSDDDEPLPRLVIVVDEFAALADELPDFLDGLVDVARRGRSLGVHLVLATQRPAGVVTGQIRANTNLRICLRVQDRSDSMDVIDRADAALLAPIPGRAVIDRGGRVSEFQVAHVSGDGVSGRVSPFVIHSAILEEEPQLGVAYRSALLRHEGLVGAASEAADVVPLGERIESCVRIAAWRPPAPWLEPLSVVDLAAIANGCDQGARTVALGMIDDPDERRRIPLLWSPADTGLLVVGADPGETERTVEVALAGLFDLDPTTHVSIFDGNGGLAHLDAVDGAGVIVGPGEGARAIKALHRLREISASASRAAPQAIVVHRWSAVADALDAESGLDACVALERLVREAADRHIAVVVTGVDERDVPTRVANRFSKRVVHRLATPSAYLAFDIRERQSESLAGRHVVEPGSSRRGLIGEVGLDDLRRRSNPTTRPRSVQVLGDRVDRSSLVSPCLDDASAVTIGLDDDLSPVVVSLDVDRPVVVLGQPGSGRSTAIETILTGRQVDAIDGDQPYVIDDGERLDQAEGEAAIAAAREAGRALVVAATPSSARGFGSWIAPLLDTAVVVLLNPARADGEVCRIVVPDLREAPRGRAVLVDRGRASIVQVAA